MIKFYAEPEQLYNLFRNAFLASKPTGMGKLHYSDNHDLTKREFLGMLLKKGGYSADYVKGRMVKLYVSEEGEGWVFNRNCNSEHSPKDDYQSWAYKYPTWQALLASVDIQLK